MMTISAVVITKNEEQMISNCIDSLRWCDEVIVVDNGSTDNTISLAEQQQATIEKLSNQASFADLRNKGLSCAKSDWILYIDADERITPRLKDEIKKVIQHSAYSAFLLKRNNVHFGKWMQYGGWGQDEVVRLFRQKHLECWEGEVHEHAIFQGPMGSIQEPLVHLTHGNLIDSMYKSIEWTPIEANLLFKASHPKITMLRLIKVMLFEFMKRYVMKKGFKDGVAGGIESINQAVNRFYVYEQLWELQQKQPLEKTYKKIEKEIAKLWEKEKK